MDAARCALRCGAEVTIVYRRSRAELPARAEEVEHAEEEGITFRLLTNPVEILGDENGFVTGIRCDTMALGEPDERDVYKRQGLPLGSAHIHHILKDVIEVEGKEPGQHPGGAQAKNINAVSTDDGINDGIEVFGVYLLLRAADLIDVYKRQTPPRSTKAPKLVRLFTLPV